MTTGVYTTEVGSSPDLVDMKALQSIFNPENESCRMPARGTSRRTATLRIPYKLDIAVGSTGDFRLGIAPMAFG